MDIWVRQTPDNAERVVAAIREFGFASDGIGVAAVLEKDAMLRMGFPPLRIELLTALSGVEFDACYAKRVRAEMGGLSVDMIALPDLIANKRACGRPKDLSDLECLA